MSRMARVEYHMGIAYGLRRCLLLSILNTLFRAIKQGINLPQTHDAKRIVQRSKDLLPSPFGSTN